MSFHILFLFSFSIMSLSIPILIINTEIILKSCFWMAFPFQPPGWAILERNSVFDNDDLIWLVVRHRLSFLEPVKRAKYFNFAEG